MSRLRLPSLSTFLFFHKQLMAFQSFCVLISMPCFDLKIVSMWSKICFLSLQKWKINCKRPRRFCSTSLCSSMKLTQEIRFFISKAIFDTTPSKTNFCTEIAAPVDKKVFSLALSRMLKSSSEDTWELEGFSWIKSYKIIIIHILVIEKTCITSLLLQGFVFYQ